MRCHFLNTEFLPGVFAALAPNCSVSPFIDYFALNYTGMMFYRQLNVHHCIVERDYLLALFRSGCALWQLLGFQIALV